MTRPPFIVLSGEAGAGKDSVAKILCDKHGWTLYSLSGPLKRFAEDMFGFTKEQLYGPSRARNEPAKRWARPCNRCDAAGVVRMVMIGGDSDEPFNRECPDCDGARKINDNSARRVLQLLGSEYLRDMIHPDALTMRASVDIEKLLLFISKQGWGGIVVNDARYENDRGNLHDWFGASRVDVCAGRPKDDGAAWRKHGSEQDRPNAASVDYTLLNAEEYPFEHLPELVDQMLATLLGKR